MPTCCRAIAAATPTAEAMQNVVGGGGQVTHGGTFCSPRGFFSHLAGQPVGVPPWLDEHVRLAVCKERQPGEIQLNVRKGGEEASSASMSSANHGSRVAGALVQQHRSVRRCDCPAWFSLHCSKQRLCRQRVWSFCDAEILPVCSVARALTASRPRCGWRMRATVGESSLAPCARLLNRPAALRCLATAAAQASGRLRYARAVVGLAQHGAARLFCDAVCIIVCRTATSSARCSRSSTPCAQY